MSKQEVINMINKLPDSELLKIANYIKLIISENIIEPKEKLDREQKELLELLNYTIDSGKKDFSENHDYYLYSSQ